MLADTSKDVKAISELLTTSREQTSNEVVENRQTMNSLREEIRGTSIAARLDVNRVVDSLNGFSNRIDEIKAVCQATSLKLEMEDVATDVSLVPPSIDQTSWKVKTTANELVVRILMEYAATREHSYDVLY